MKQIDARLFGSDVVTAIITNADQWGMIPSFIDVDDETPLKDQFDAGYFHGGGWRPHPTTKWEVRKLEDVDHAVLHSLTHNEDFEERGRIYRGDELAIIFDASFVAYSPTGEAPFEVSRMD